MRTIAAILFAALSLPCVIAQPPATAPPSATTNPAANSPIGHWVANHPGKDALALWWDFRTDGTLTLNAGAIVNSTYKLSGTTLTLTANEPGAASEVFNVHFSNGKLYTTPHTAHPSTMEFTRIGPQPNSGPNIVGTWSVSDAQHTNDPAQEQPPNRTMNTVVVYEANGSYHLRTPVKSFAGNWNPTTQTYKLKPYPPLYYQRRGDNLLIALPPGGKQKHLYLPDTVLNPITLDHPAP
jgi:hypothetical protein